MSWRDRFRIAKRKPTPARSTSTSQASADPATTSQTSADPTSASQTPADPAGQPSSHASERESARLGRAELLDALRAEVARNTDGQLAPDAVPASARIYDEGIIDSIGAASLLAFIEDRYGVAIDEVELLGRLATLEDMASHILSQRERRGA